MTTTTNPPRPTPTRVVPPQRPTRPSTELDPDQPAITLEGAMLLLLSAAGGALMAVLVVPHWVPALQGSLAGPEPKAYWYLSRASGLVAYVLLWLSIVFGLLITGKLAGLWPGGPTTVDLHQFSGLLGLGFAVFHGVILLGDRYIGYTPLQLLVPFAGRDYRPLGVGLGQLGFYVGLVVAFSFYVRRRIGHRTWRLLHFGSFGMYLLVTAHGLTAGTDAALPAAFGLYVATGLVTFFLTVFRILVSGRRARLATG